MKTLTLDEFRQFGLLHEINRQLLHPIGLALSVVVDTDEQGNIQANTQTEFTVRVIDCREDPEGFMYDTIDQESIEKYRRFLELFEAKREVREKVLGWHVQPVPEVSE